MLTQYKTQLIKIQVLLGNRITRGNSPTSYGNTKVNYFFVQEKRHV